MTLLEVVPWDRALLSVVKGSVVRTKSRAVPNTPLRGSYEESGLCIAAGQRYRRHGLTRALRIRRLGVRIPSGALITAGQSHFSGVTTWLAVIRRSVTQGDLLTGFAGLVVPVACRMLWAACSSVTMRVPPGSRAEPLLARCPKYAPKFCASTGLRTRHRHQRCGDLEQAGNPCRRRCLRGVHPLAHRMSPPQAGLASCGRSHW